MAKRIAVQYAGAEYAISGREFDEVLKEIAKGSTGPEAHWLTVAIGLGRATEAKLLLGPGIPIAAWVVNTDGPESPTEDDPDHHSE
jgi:hypothetical protein